MSNKILFIVNNLGTGGAEKMFLEEIKLFSSRGYDVFLTTLYVNESKNTELASLNIRNISFLGFKNLYDISGYVRLIKLVKEKGINRMYSTLDDANFIARLIKISCPKLKVYIREGNIVSKKSLKMRIADILLNIFVDKIIAVSYGVEKSILYSSKVTVIENAVNLPPEFVSAKNKKEMTIICVGSLAEKKGHLFLFEALKDANFDFHLNIAGEGSLRPHLESFIKEHNMGDKITLLGFLNKEELNQAYLKSDIFVLSSKWEGFPNVVLEAMSYALPVVSTKVSGAEDIIEDGKSGFLVPSGNKKKLTEVISKLAKDYSLREKIGKGARERVKNNLMDKHIDKLIDTLQL